jgi:hypothetical protein
MQVFSSQNEVVFERKKRRGMFAKEIMEVE